MGEVPGAVLHVRMRPVGGDHELARGLELIVPRKADGDAPRHDPTSSASSASGSCTGWRQAKSRHTNAVARPWSANRSTQQRHRRRLGCRGHGQDAERVVAAVRAAQQRADLLVTAGPR